MGVKSLNHSGSDLHLTSLRTKSSQHLPPSFLKLGTRGFFVILSSLQHVSRCLKVQNQHSCGIWHKWHGENKRKILFGKERMYECPYGGIRESLEYFEIVPLTGKHELGWLSPDIKGPQKRQLFSTEASIFCALMPTALTFKQCISRLKDAITPLCSALQTHIWNAASSLKLPDTRHIYLQTEVNSAGVTMGWSTCPVSRG